MRHVSILVVEDDELQRRLLKSQLERMGHRVFEAADGNQALRVYHSESIEVVITDVMMPDRDGLELILELKRSVPDLPMIAISGGMSMANYDPLPLARLFGASVLSKPFSQKELESVLDPILATLQS